MFQQIAILIEGMNPEAGGPLTDGELSRVRAALQADEHLSSFVRGRVVGAGGALWVLTEQRLLLLKDGRRRNVDTLPIAAIQRLALQAGRYGSTLALFTADRRLSIFAADAGLARAFAAALAHSLPAGALPADASTAPTADESADVATWVSWSRLRLMPSAHQGMADNLVLLREAATLHERGMLGAAEFGALKGRLLDAA